MKIPKEFELILELPNHLTDVLKKQLDNQDHKVVSFHGGIFQIFRPDVQLVYQTKELNVEVDDKSSKMIQKNYPVSKKECYCNPGLVKFFMKFNYSYMI